MTILRYICALIFISEIPQPSVCSKQAVLHRNVEKYLANHVIETKQAESELECGMHCVAKESCASVNYKTAGIGKGRCELNNKTFQDTSDVDEKIHNPEFNHLSIIKPKRPQPDSPKTSEITEKPTSTNEELSSSCKELLQKDKSLSNGVYQLRKSDSLEKYHVYCHMTELSGCGEGGWTLLMKIHGHRNEFSYYSDYWTNKETYAVEDGLQGLNEKQTKLASYWNTPFNKICLGMKFSGVTKWIVIDHQASSLFNVIADGVHTKTTAGRDTWKSLIASSSLQLNCNDEGFNVKCSRAHVRIGLAANNEDDCDSCESYIGFGAFFLSTEHCGFKPAITCGNLADCSDVSHYNADTEILAFGYILVQ